MITMADLRNMPDEEIQRMILMQLIQMNNRLSHMEDWTGQIESVIKEIKYRI